MSFDEDYSVFFDTAEHADTAIFGTGGNQEEVDGFFKNAYKKLEHDHPFETSSRSPEFLCPEDEVEAFDEGDPVIINGENYTIADKEPDGTGLVRVILWNA